MAALVLLGSTGSIGTQTLDVVAAHPDAIRVRALAAAGTRPELLARQVREHKPEVVALADPAALEPLLAQLRALGCPAPRIEAGPGAIVELAGAYPADVVLNGITGAVGLRATLAALRSGATLALANKESLVVGGDLVRRAQRRPGQVVPVDSEHSAIAQALRAGVHERGMTAPRVTGRSELAQIVLTASGGPFRGLRRAQLRDVTPAQALNHPTWNMGPVVTINSSTLVNKGLELIEASLLFDVDPQRIVPVVHPSSIVHSMVTWRDGATIAQASPPDMRLPIALGMCWPERLENVVPACDFTKPQTWDFRPVDHETFPALRLAAQCVAASPSHPAVFNAANEVMVAAFLAKRAAYLDIVDTVADVVAEHEGIAQPSLDDIEGVQQWARSRAREIAAERRRA